MISLINLILHIIILTTIFNFHNFICQFMCHFKFNINSILFLFHFHTLNNINLPKEFFFQILLIIIMLHNFSLNLFPIILVLNSKY